MMSLKCILGFRRKLQIDFCDENNFLFVIFLCSPCHFPWLMRLFITAFITLFKLMVVKLNSHYRMCYDIGYEISFYNKFHNSPHAPSLC